MTIIHYPTGAVLAGWTLDNLQTLLTKSDSDLMYIIYMNDGLFRFSLTLLGVPLRVHYRLTGIDLVSTCKLISIFRAFTVDQFGEFNE